MRARGWFLRFHLSNGLVLIFGNSALAIYLVRGVACRYFSNGIGIVRCSLTNFWLRRSGSRSEVVGVFFRISTRITWLYSHEPVKNLASHLTQVEIQLQLANLIILKSDDKKMTIEQWTFGEIEVNLVPTQRVTLSRSN